MKHTLALFLLLCLTACTQWHEPEGQYDAAAPLSQRFDSVMLPVGIAAPNFYVKGADRGAQAEFVAKDGSSIQAVGSDSALVFDLDEWHEFMASAAKDGGDVRLEVSTPDDAGHWRSYPAIHLSVTTDTVPRYLSYRLLYPGYQLWNEMGIYQRDLTTYDETPILENKAIGTSQCVNCHYTLQGDPATRMLHIRGAGETSGTWAVRGGELKRIIADRSVSTSGIAYPSWHPDGRHLAFASNDIQQFFHQQGKVPIEVTDLSARLVIVDSETGETTTVPALSDPHYLYTFPQWSPDGRTLYFARALLPDGATEMTPSMIDLLHYDLCSLPAGEGGAIAPDAVVTTVYAAAAEGMSATHPQLSPDGRWMVFTRIRYGSFSIWHPEADFWLIDMEQGIARPLDELNSADVESFHQWSPDGRWMVFSSKRDDTLWARPYLAHFDADTGRFAFPLLLPQADPTYYDTFTLTYNIPQFLIAPTQWPADAFLARAR